MIELSKKPYFPSPYYDDQDNILGFGVFNDVIGDWIIEDGLTEPQAISFAEYLNSDISLARLSEQHGDDFVRTTLTFYGLE